MRGQMAAAVAPTQISDTYQALMMTASSEHGKHYAAYKQSVDGITAKIEEWTKRLNELSNGQVPFNRLDVKQEVIGKVREYKQLREMRENIYKIIGIYFDVISKSRPPSMDEGTLLVLKRLGLDTVGMKATYDRVFISELATLETQQKEFTVLYGNLTQKTMLPALRKKLEEIIIFTKEYNGFPEPTTGDRWKGYTPNVTAALRSLEEKN